MESSSVEKCGVIGMNILRLGVIGTQLAKGSIIPPNEEIFDIVIHSFNISLISYKLGSKEKTA